MKNHLKSNFFLFSIGNIRILSKFFIFSMCFQWKKQKYLFLKYLTLYANLFSISTQPVVSGLNNTHTSSWDFMEIKDCIIFQSHVNDKPLPCFIRGRRYFNILMEKPALGGFPAFRFHRPITRVHAFSSINTYFPQRGLYLHSDYQTVLYCASDIITRPLLDATILLKLPPARKFYRFRR